MRSLLVVVLSFSLLIPLFGSEIMKGEAIAYREKGYKLQAMGDFAQALSYYQKAIQIDPLYVEVLNDLGVVYENLADDECALNMYQEALRLNPRYRPAHTNLAFFYERKGNIDKATEHWARRYELGEEGEYWREVALQHLLRLGTYPEAKKDWLERAAARLSQELMHKREQEGLKLIEEAKLHFDIAKRMFMKGDYARALKELEAAGDLNPPDEDLRVKIFDLYKKSFRMQKKAEAVAFTQDALTYLHSDSLISAGDKLKDALRAVIQVAQERIGE
jgi:tetratricopeptide (TPR) repeat protein